jgi:hypothetical protein
MAFPPDGSLQILPEMPGNLWHTVRESDTVRLVMRDSKGKEMIYEAVGCRLIGVIRKEES